METGSSFSFRCTPHPYAPGPMVFLVPTWCYAIDLGQSRDIRALFNLNQDSNQLLALLRETADGRAANRWQIQPPSHAGALRACEP
jgi:hypothetical protein